MSIRMDIQKLVQIAKMYYEKNMTQEQISKKLNISRSAISMLLTEAKKMKIVNITINDPLTNNVELAEEFKKRFGLEDCLVVPTTVTEGPLLVKIITSSAVALACEKMKSHSTVGVAWGTTCYEFIHQFPDDSGLTDINIVPLIGGSSLVSAEYQINETVRMYAEKLYGTPMFIYSPGIVEYPKDKQKFMDSLYLQNIIEKWDDLDFVVLGIGAAPEHYGYNSIGFNMEEMEKSIKENPNKPVGDFVARRFNIKGEILQCEYNNKIIGAEEIHLRKAKNVMAIAAGNYKVFSIIGALNSKLMTYLITDELTAKNVLAVYDSGSLDEYMF